LSEVGQIHTVYSPTPVVV